MRAMKRECATLVGVQDVRERYRSVMVFFLAASLWITGRTVGRMDMLPEVPEFCTGTPEMPLIRVAWHRTSGFGK